MKKSFITAAVLALSLINSARADVNTDPVLKGNPLSLIAVKTDPVLQPRLDSKTGLTLNFAPAGVAGFSLTFSSADKLRGFNVNIQPVLELVSILAQKGSKVDMRVVDTSGFSTLEIMVNGKALAPMAIGCDECKIEVEY